MTNLASTASAITDDQIRAFKEAFHGTSPGSTGYDEAVRIGLGAALAAPTTQPTGQAETPAFWWSRKFDESGHLHREQIQKEKSDWRPYLPGWTVVHTPLFAAAEPSRPAADDWETVKLHLASVMLGFRAVSDATYEDACKVVESMARPDGMLPFLRASRTPAPAAPSEDAKDAARYRFLRNMRLDGDEFSAPYIHAAESDDNHWALTRENADSEVDAAIASSIKASEKK